MISVCLFEDDGYKTLFPLTLERPAYSLLTGIGSLFDKVTHYYGADNLSLHCRDSLKSTVKTTYPGLAINTINTGTPCLFINGRLWMNDAIYTELNKIDRAQDYLVTSQGQVVALYLQNAQLSEMIQLLVTTASFHDILTRFRPKCIAKEIDATLITHPWDLITLNSHTLNNEFHQQKLGGIIQGDLYPFVAIYNENNVFVGKHTVIEDFVVLDATKGPIYIAENVHVEAHSRLEGPLYIGSHTQVLGGKIRGSSIGNHCKVAGEVSTSIFGHYTNKAHAGFVGNSYLGQWVNLGAMTTTSNLKNTYGSITLQLPTGPVPTHQQFLGAIVGDHTKTAIGTLLSTGTVVGLGSVLLGSTPHSRYIPNFAWGEAAHYGPVQLDSFLTTLKRVMTRRNLELTDDYAKLLADLHHQWGMK